MKAFAPGPRHTVVGLFLRLFLPVAAICTLGVGFLFQSEVNSNLLRTLSFDKTAIQVGASSISRTVQSITSDLAFLAEQHSLKEIITKPDTSKVEQNLLNDWLTFSRSKGIYDQIRWIDATGQERARVNYNHGKPRIVPRNKLQNKGKRYYFTDAVGLNEGEFFISPLDLNIEHGKIETPLKPMIRLGTPVFDSNKKQQGVLLLNYFGNKLLKEFDRVTGNAKSRAWIVNQDGYWLKGPSRDMEWGFMYERPDATISALFPEAWHEIVSAKSGQFENEKGYWTFSTIYPLVEGQKTSSGSYETFSPSRDRLESRDYFWKAVTLHPRVAYRTTVWRTGSNLFLALVLLLLGLCYGSWRLASAWIREEEAEEELLQINLGLEATVAERTKELRSEITVRKKAEEELREWGERFRSITATASVAIIITIDQDGCIVTWNPAAEKAFGYSKAEMDGRPITLCMPERYREGHNQGLKRAVATKETKIVGGTVELHGLRKNGEEFPLELSIGTWMQGGTQYFSAVIIDITERKAAEKKLKYLATHDQLTGLPTRVLCNDHIDGAMANARRKKSRAAILFVDLDGFKTINDTFGHDAGDRLLIGVAERLTSCVREVDTVARIGGDEFLVVISDVENRESAGVVAQKLVDMMGKPFLLQGKEASIGASVGVSIYPDDAENKECLVRCADEAMYVVKSQGKDGFVFAQDLELERDE